MAHKKVGIIGAGITGLSCALHLQKAGIDFDIYEASNRVGGRVRSEHIDGFTLDVGFQVFVESYPEFKSLLNYKDLQLGYFDSAARLVDNDVSISFYNPLIHPAKGLATALNAWGTWADKAKLLPLLIECLSAPRPTKQTGLRTEDYLAGFGFSPAIIRRFFRPFFGDIFLDRDLSPDAAFFAFIFKQFAHTRAALPAGGMAAIPAQMATSLEPSQLFLQTKASSADLLADYDWVVNTVPEESTTSFYGTEVLYYTGHVERSPGRVLVMNVQDDLVRSACLLSDVQPAYAPMGQTLLSVTLAPYAHGLSIDSLKQQVLPKLHEWFGAASEFKLLQRSQVPQSLPKKMVGEDGQPFKINGKVLTGGDAYAYPSLDGAAYSGRSMAAYIEKS